MTWAQGEGGQVAQSLTHSLLLLEDVRFYAKAVDESLTIRLQWHVIAITFLIRLFLD